MSCKPRHINKLLSFCAVSLGGITSFAAYNLINGDERFYSTLLMPLMTKYVDPETAHKLCLYATKYKLIRCQDTLTQEQSARLKTQVLGYQFSNPIGLAAGFDKDSEVVGGLHHYGLGFAELGTVTPKAQPGNPKKRIFRIPETKSIINRCGFNNNGIEYARDNLTKQPTYKPLIVGLNLGKNKDSISLAEDYTIGIERCHDIKAVDYIVINISSPNTPGLRDYQAKKNLELLLNEILQKMEKLSVHKPLLVKLAPDLSVSQLKDIVDIISNTHYNKMRVSGVILTNTTVTRPTSLSDETCPIVYKEPGGLSGQPLRDMSTKMISEFYKLTHGKMPIIGVGGVSSGQDAYDKIRAGASLVQLYTGITYDGPPIVNKIKRELVQLLERDNITSVSEAIGLDHKAKK